MEVLNASMETLKKLRTLPEAPTAPPVPPAGLLRLPFEIRLQIYRYCIPRRYLITVATSRILIEGPYGEVDLTRDESTTFEADADLDLEDIYVLLDLSSQSWDRFKSRAGIFRVSKQIGEEALDIFYGENTFNVRFHEENGEACFKQKFSEANRRRMRYLLVTSDTPYNSQRMPDNALWSSMLPKLKCLRIVIEQPDKAYDAPTFEEEMVCWGKWISPFLQCFGQYLSGETIVQVDVDGQAEIRELVEEYITQGFREIQCHLVGDRLFTRGQFAWGCTSWPDDGT